MTDPNDWLESHHRAAWRAPLQVDDLLRIERRCARCAHRGTVVHRLRHPWPDLRTVAEIAAFGKAKVETRCGSCGATGEPDEGIVELAIHAPAHEGWLVVTPDADGKHRLRLVPFRGPDFRVAPESAECQGALRAARLRDMVDRVSDGLPEGGDNIPTDLLDEIHARPSDPLPATALAYALLRCGRAREALAAFEQALRLDGDSPGVAADAGLLAAAHGRTSDAAGWLALAWHTFDEERLIAPLLRTAWQSDRGALLRRVLDELGERCPDHLDAARARALLGDATDIDAARDGWRHLEKAATAAGHRRIAAVAAHAARALSLPFPNFPCDMEPDHWIRDARIALEECGYAVQFRPDPIHIGEGPRASFHPVALEIELPDDEVLLVLLTPLEPGEAGLATLDAALAALQQDPRARAGVLPIARSPIAFTTWLRCTPCAERDMIHRTENMTDVTLTVEDDALSSLVEDIEHLVGETLKPLPDHLDRMDDLVVRWHEGGFARPPLGLQVRLARWYGAVLAHARPGARWVPSDEEGSDPMILAGADGTRLNLVSIVGRAMHHGRDEAPGILIRHLLALQPPPAPTGTVQ